MLNFSKQKILIMGFTLYLFSFLGMTISPAFSYIGALQLSRRLFIVSTMLTIVAIISLYVIREIISEKIKFQMVVVYFCLLLMFLPIYFRNRIEGYAQYSYFGWIQLVAFGVGFMFWFIILVHKMEYFKKTVRWLIKNKILIIITLAVFVVSMEQITKWLRWDTIHYYAYIERIKEFTFNPNDILLFKASGHACYAYVLIYSIGESILPGMGYGVRFETILIFITSIILLYRIMEIVMPSGKRIWRNFSIALYAFTPVILGPIHNIDVEILFMTLFFALFYCYIKKYYIFTLFFGVLFVFTKETGIILMLGFLLYEIIIILNILKKHHSIISKISRRWKSYLSLYLAPLIFVFYFSIDTAWGSTKVKENVDKFNVWGWDWTVVINKIKQLFVMNFTWISTLIILTAIVFFIAKGQWHKKRNPYYMLIYCCYSVFFLAQTLYITYTFPRYIYIQYFYITMAIQGALNIIFCSHVIKEIVCTILLGLTFAQNFYALDIVSKNIFSTMSIGSTEITVNAPLAYLDNTTLLKGDEASFLALSPYADMNRQWSYFDELINKFLETIDYKEDTLIIYPDTFYPRSANIFFGMWSDSVFDSKDGRLKQKISSGYKTDNMHRYNAYVINEEIDNINDYTNIYYLEFPFKENSQNSLPISTEVVDTIEIYYRGWMLKAYKIKGE